MNAPSIAAVVVHHRDLERTSAAVRSAAAETAVRTVYLLDNGSDDDLSALASTPALRLLRSETNLGFAAGSNLAARRALDDGLDALLFLNSDAVLEDGAAELLLDRMRAASAAVVVPKVLEPGSPVRLESCGGQIDNGRIGRFGEHELDLGQHDQPSPIAWAPGAAMLVDGKPFMAVAGFDARYFLYLEDVDLSLRLRARGLTLWREPAARARHDRRLGTTEDGVYYGTRNRFLLGAAHGAALDQPLYAIRSALRLASRASRLLATGRRAELRALRAGVADGLAGRFGEPHDG